jgi:hypothetical protein
MSCRQFQLLAQHSTPLAGEGGHLRGQHHQRRHRGQSCRQVAASRHLPLLARFLAAAGRRFFGFALIAHCQLLNLPFA